MSEEVNRLLQEGIAAAKAGDKARARRLLIEATDLDQQNEQAWLWLSGVVDDLEEMRICLENVLTINPGNERARQGLTWIQSRLGPPAPPPPAPAPPPAAPWEPPPEPASATETPIPPPPPAVAGPEEPQPHGSRVPCPQCGTLNYDFADRCIKCGFPLTIQCLNCGEIVPTERGICPHCGTDLPLPRKLGAVREREEKLEEAYRQGLADLEEGRYQEAKESLEQVIAISPGHVEALHNLGLACAKLGQAAEARQYWEEVQRLNPDYPDIQRDLDSLLSPQERRRLAKQRKKGEPTPRKKPAAEKKEPAEGQGLLVEIEAPPQPEPPVPEEEMGGLEILLYVLMVGLVIGVAYALNRPSTVTGLPPERIARILKQSGVITALLLAFWIVLGILTSLLSKVFKGRGAMGGYMASSARFLMPFFLLILPIVLGIPLLVERLPESIRPWLKQFPAGSPLESLPPPPWLLFGALALFWGLFALVRGVSRVGRMAMWKGFLVSIVALVIAVAIVGGGGYLGYTMLEGLGYMDVLGFGPEPTPTPGP